MLLHIYTLNFHFGFKLNKVSFASTVTNRFYSFQTMDSSPGNILPGDLKLYCLQIYNIYINQLTIAETISFFFVIV
jgi:hypothetical protein